MSYETKYYCDTCEIYFYKMTEHDPRKVSGRLPACPECKKSKKATEHSRIKVRGDVEAYVAAREAPPIPIDQVRFSIGGTNPKNKAFDMTAEIVMQDYGMTDINMNSNMRQGDNAVPKLAPELERKVDEVFKPQKNNVSGLGGNALNKTLIKQINAGVFKNYGGSNDVVARQQQSGISIPTKILHEYREKPH